MRMTGVSPLTPLATGLIVPVRLHRLSASLDADAACMPYLNPAERDRVSLSAGSVLTHPEACISAPP